MPANLNQLEYLPPDENPKIIYYDDYLIVVDKPSGLLSVPGRGEDKQDCLITRIHANYPAALIVHRLDMATSGLMVLARKPLIHRHLSILFQEKQVGKQYLAVVDGIVKTQKGHIDLPLITDWPNRPRQKVDHNTGKPSKTYFEVIRRNLQDKQTRVRLSPKTGRTHQLRVHMQALGHPIVGDLLYNPTVSTTARLCLHAERLSFTHPLTQQPMTFTSAAPF